MIFNDKNTRMNIKTATLILKRHNLWRRGNRKILPIEPTRLGEAIEYVVSKLENHIDLSLVSSTDNYKCCDDRSLMIKETTYFDENGREQGVDLLYCENCGYNKLD